MYANTWGDARQTWFQVDLADGHFGAVPNGDWILANDYAYAEYDHYRGVFERGWVGAVDLGNAKVVNKG